MMIAALILGCIAAALSVVTGFANVMSDTPTERPFTFRVPVTLLLVAVALFVCSRAFAAAVDPIRPDPELTPGVTDPGITQANIHSTICVSGYTAKVRNVPAAEKRAVFAEYGIAPSGNYEIDHLISLEIGGANDPKNLWPQSYHTMPWNAHRKDRVENYLHREICAGRMTLKAAQDAIRTDWIAVYQQAFGEPQ